MLGKGARDTANSRRTVGVGWPWATAGEPARTTFTILIRMTTRLMAAPSLSRTRRADSTRLEPVANPFILNDSGGQYQPSEPVAPGDEERPATCPPGLADACRPGGRAYG